YQLHTFFKIQNDQVNNASIKIPSPPPVILKVIA
ncbi:twin-arginine translocase subunit TatB, partial [Staphylococcus warneri]